MSISCRQRPSLNDLAIDSANDLDHQLIEHYAMRSVDLGWANLPRPKL
jgi:hypothetical protein